MNYIRLREGLRIYEKIAEYGGWPTINPGPILKPGDKGERVYQLKRRLLITGDLDKIYEDKKYVYNKQLTEAVKHFQRRHGLITDGVAGKKTLEILNIPVQKRIRQLKINMERVKKLPEYLGDRCVVVNIPDYRLTLFEKGEPVLSMKAIVGKEDRQTPVFQDEIVHIVFNPYWEIPQEIIINDMLPQIIEDVGYLEENNINVVQGWGENARKVQPEKINWTEVSEDNLHYRLRQEPGENNQLGRVKFIFPNKYGVYIHDTPDKHLFSFNRRDFSSGCIRIEKPLELARQLLADKEDWLLTKVEQVLQSGEEKKVNLESPVPVYLVYWTAWVTERGIVNFRQDIYHKDSR